MSTDAEESEMDRIRPGDYNFHTVSDTYGEIEVIGDRCGFVAFYRKGGSEFYMTPGELSRFIDTLIEASGRNIAT